MRFNSLHSCSVCVLIAASAAALPAAASAQSDLKLGVDGLGQIDASTPFDLRTLRSIDRGVTWKRSTRATESGYEDVITGTRRGRTLVTLISDGRGRIASIEVESSQIDNWLGPRVGEAHQPLERNLQLGSCEPGQEAQSGSVVCSSAESNQISYVFSGRWNGPDGEMPPANVLSGWTVSSLIWKTERFAQIGRPQAERPPVKPSFDCNRASGSIERMICDDPELAELDNRMSSLYARKYEAAGMLGKIALRAQQVGWIRGRNDCWKSGDRRQCVVGAYSDRIAELQDHSDTQGLAGTSWKGVRIAGDRIPADINIDVTFETDGRLNGSSGCNRYFGSYRLDGRNLEVSQIGGTRRMCPDREMQAESRFLDALGKIDGWAMRNGDLILFGRGAELTFVRQ